MNTQELQTVKQRFGIIGNAAGLDRAMDVALQVAPTDLTVLITGESGVGKERFPQIIHAYSTRKHGTYISVNCGAIPEGTIDSELFGHEKGAFTGATTDRKGYFEVADGGTIFLDEVGELPLATQVRLLRVLETGEFIRVGSSKVQKTDVRVIAATNLDMPRAIAEGRFREDLYYRLNTVPISIPPLRERKEDIPLLFRKFAADFSEKYRMPPLRLTDDARALLCNYYWNGNIRQLKNITEQISVIERNREVDTQTLRRYLPENEIGRTPMLFKAEHSHADQSFANERELLYKVLFDMKEDVKELKKLVHDIMSGNTVASDDTRMMTKYTDDAALVPSMVSFPDVSKTSAHVSDTVPEFVEYQEAESEEYKETVEQHHAEANTLQDMEKEMIKRVLEANHGRRNATAAALNISERTLYRKLKEYDLFQPKRKNKK